MWFLRFNEPQERMRGENKPEEPESIFKALRWKLASASVHIRSPLVKKLIARTSWSTCRRVTSLGAVFNCFTPALNAIIYQCVCSVHYLHLLLLHCTSSWKSYSAKLLWCEVRREFMCDIILFLYERNWFDDTCFWY
jgi:hypothetical protein